MAGGIILIGLALALFVYVIGDRLRPPHSRAVAAMEGFRSEWKRYYGWNYLERPLAAGRSPAALRVGGFVADKLQMQGFFAARLERAGVTITPDRFIAWHMGAVFSAGLLIYLSFGPLWATVVIILGAAAPFAVLPVLAGRRRTRIDDQLADTLQLIGSLLRAGHGFPQALAAVTRETGPPISHVLKKVSAQVKLGGTIEEGLDKVAAEVGSTALGLAVTAIKIQREVGGNLSEILDILSKSIRERGELNRQIKALTAEGRLSAYILLALPFVLVTILYFTNRRYMALLWETVPGLIMLGLAVLLMIVGSLWLWRMIRVDI